MKNYIARMIDLLTEEMPGSLPVELLKLYANLAFVKGTWTTLEDVHDAWAIWKNEIDPNHRSLIPFDELTHEVQELDRPYMDSIHRAVRRYVLDTDNN